MMNEIEIIENVLGGDVDAYASLVNRYQMGVIIYCENIVHDRQDAEDIAQEAFIKAYNSLSKFNTEKGRFSTWLYRIAGNLAIDSIRKTKHKVAIEDIEQYVEATMPAHLEEDERQSLRAMILRLEPPKYATIIQAYYWEGKSYQQLATDFGTSTNTIGTWMSRAKAQLKKELSL